MSDDLSHVTKAALAARVRELEAELDALRAARGGRTGLSLPIDPLAEHAPGYLPRHVDMRLHLRHARTLAAIYRYCQARHLTMPHPTDPHAVRHVDSPADALRWLLEQVRLTGVGGGT